MITSKKDCATIRAAITRLRSGPTFNLGVPLDSPEAKRRIILWAETWITRELESLLPTNERISYVQSLTE